MSDDGYVWTWGDNSTGAIGDGTKIDRLKATRVKKLDSVKSISCGFYHIVALKKDGTVWAWGNNMSKQVAANSHDYYVLAPVKVKGLNQCYSCFCWK